MSVEPTHDLKWALGEIEMLASSYVEENLLDRERPEFNARYEEIVTIIESQHAAGVQEGRRQAIEAVQKLRAEQARKWNYSRHSLDHGRMQGAELAISIIEFLGAAEPPTLESES